MPRIARKQSSSSIYHVFNRGVGKQIIFESDSDRLFYMRRLSELLDELDGTLLAWCLMDNHYHLLLQIPFEQLSSLLHRLQTSYAGYFNRTHNHTGSLFGSRFKSEAVETDEYLMTVVKYIHENPVKAELPQGIHYPWSSYDEYLEKPRYVDTTPVLGVFGSVGQFLAFHEASDGSDSHLDIEDGRTACLTDDDAMRIANEALGAEGVLSIKGLERAQRDAALVQLKERGLGVRQIRRLTGVPLSVISRAR